MNASNPNGGPTDNRNPATCVRSKRSTTNYGAMFYLTTTRGVVQVNSGAKHRGLFLEAGARFELALFYFTVLQTVPSGHSGTRPFEKS